MAAHYLAYLAETGHTEIHPFGRAATDCLLDALALVPGQRVLEIGCGTGSTLVWAASWGVQVVGIDLLPAMLRTAQKRRQWVRVEECTAVLQANAAALPIASGAMDRVYMESVLGFQTAVAAQAILKHIFRVLRPGGRLVANEAIWRPEVSAEQAQAIYTASMADFGICQASEQAWHLQEWLALMQQTGFTIQDAPRVETITKETHSQIPPSVVLSDEFTQSRRSRRFWPWLLWQRWQYRRRLARHQADGQWIEARLFVLEKPAATK